MSICKLLAILILVFSLPVACQAEGFDPSRDKVSIKQLRMTDSRGGHSATLLDDGRVLIAGGNNALLTGPGTAEIYDPKTMTFKRVGNMNNPRSNHKAVKLQDGRVLVLGGSGRALGPKAFVEIFDPKTETFQKLPDVYLQIQGFTATLLPDGRVMIIEGTTVPAKASGTTTDIILFDPKTNQFESFANLHVRRHQHFAFLLPDGNVLVAGGNSLMPDDGPTDRLAYSFELIDVQKKTVTLIPTPPISSYVSKSDWAGPENAYYLPAPLPDAMHDQLVMVNNSNIIWPSAQVVIRPAENWRFERTGPRHIYFRSKYAANLLPDGRILIAGGIGQFKTGYRRPTINNIPIEIYNPLTNHFYKVGILKHSKKWPQMVVLKDGSVLMTGGLDGDISDRYHGSDVAYLFTVKEGGKK